MFMRQAGPEMRQSLAHDLGRRALYASVGGGILAFLGTMGLMGHATLLPPIAAALVTVALVVWSIRLLNAADRQPPAESRPVNVRASYLLITRMEYFGFLAALLVCELFNQMIWLLPAVAIISGLHYLALGRLLPSRSSYIKGAILCLLAVATVLFAPPLYPPHAAASAQVYLWWVIVGVGGGLVLWFDAVQCLTLGQRSMAASTAS
ncbi:MAG: hypothetical protein KGO05_08970 [Chloroflexota bacterium]|nr:hypothetical protein [Chloroflexota bacterium]